MKGSDHYVCGLQWQIQGGARMLHSIQHLSLPGGWYPPLRNLENATGLSA